MIFCPRSNARGTRPGEGPPPHRFCKALTSVPDHSRSTPSSGSLGLDVCLFCPQSTRALSDTRLRRRRQRIVRQPAVQVGLVILANRRELLLPWIKGPLLGCWAKSAPNLSCLPCKLPVGWRTRPLRGMKTWGRRTRIVTRRPARVTITNQRAAETVCSN